MIHTDNALTYTSVRAMTVANSNNIYKFKSYIDTHTDAILLNRKYLLCFKTFNIQ